MGAETQEGVEVSFFELDRLFMQSAKALRRKQRRQRRRERAGIGGSGDEDRSRSPVKGRWLAKKVAGLGGFTGKVDKVARTVIVTGVPESVDEKALFKHFSKCGTVSDVRRQLTRHQYHTGIVIVEFAEDDAINRACNMPAPHNALNGTELQVKRADDQIPKPDAEGAPMRTIMTRQQFTQQVLSQIKAGEMGTTGEASGPNMRKLYIKNLRPVVTEEDMRGIFKPFGEFDTFEMGNQECWITFMSHNDASDAMGSMQGFQLVAQELQIVLQSASVTPAAVPSMSKPPPVVPPVQPMDLKNDTDFGATGASMNPLHSRIELMKKLMTSHQQQGVPAVVGFEDGTTAAQAQAIASAAVPPTPKPGTPLSKTLLLQNMFTASTVDLEKDPKFYEEIREDTHDECAKFGRVLHVTVDPRGSTGLIYVLFEVPSQRQAAEVALNGRWFEGKKIIANGIDDSIWQDLAAQQAHGA